LTVLAEGRRRAAATRGVHDRWTGALIGEVAEDGPAEADAAVKTLSGRQAVPPPAERAEVLARAADLLEARAGELAELITAESGVCRRETDREVVRAAANLRVASAEALRIRGETILLPSGDRLAVTLREPVGLVAAITPFNRPLNQVVVKVAPAVAAGCTVLLKPSEQTPLTALRFAELLAEAGLPKDRLAVVTGAPDSLGPAVAGHPGVDMVTFTGSVRVGRQVAATAAAKRQLLELGGNDPLFVLPDADVAAAARLAADGSCATAGQSCRGVKRIIVWEEVADDLVERLVAAVAAKKAGDPRSLETDLGPLVTEAAAAEVERRVNAAVDAGAERLVGGDRHGALLEPVVLDRVPADAELVQEETFGPVAPVLRVRDLDEAVAVSNGTPYGLQAGVVTNDMEAFWELAARLRVGAVNLGEGPHFDSPYIPFGGVKASGVGREGIPYAVAEMTTLKTVTLPRGSGRE
jgi:acyl-CoA reductase-like NAD-dependent aldehyde dehydrogenase